MMVIIDTCEIMGTWFGILPEEEQKINICISG
jgi:hypothetical protein